MQDNAPPFRRSRVSRFMAAIMAPTSLTHRLKTKFSSSSLRRNGSDSSIPKAKRVSPSSSLKKNRPCLEDIIDKRRTMDPMGYDCDELRQDGFFFRPTELFSPRDLPSHVESDEREHEGREETGRSAQGTSEKPRTRSRNFKSLMGRPPTPPKAETDVDIYTSLHSHPVRPSSEPWPPRSSSLFALHGNSTSSLEHLHTTGSPSAPVSKSPQQPITVKRWSSDSGTKRSSKKLSPLLLVERNSEWLRSLETSQSKHSSPTTPHSGRTARSSVTDASTPKSSLHSEYEGPTGWEAEQMIKSGSSAQASRRSSLLNKHAQSQESLTPCPESRKPFAAPDSLAWRENERPQSQTEKSISDKYEEDLATIEKSYREFDVTPLGLRGYRTSISDFRFPATCFSSDDPEHFSQTGDLAPDAAESLSLGSDEPQHTAHTGDLAPDTAESSSLPTASFAPARHRRQRSASVNPMFTSAFLGRPLVPISGGHTPSNSTSSAGITSLPSAPSESSVDADEQPRPSIDSAQIQEARIAYQRHGSATEVVLKPRSSNSRL